MSDQFTEIYRPPAFISYDGEFSSNSDKVLEWLDKNIKDSQAFLRSNRGWKSADICMAIFYGDETERIPKGLSKVSVKKLRRQAREAVANAANIRPNWQHRSRKEQYQPQAETYDKLRDDWFYTQDVYHKVKEAIQYAAGGGTGYIWLWPKFDKATGELEITPTVLDWRQVLPFHACKDTNVDSAYGICVHMEWPVPYAHEEFPNHINIIQADRNVPSSFTKNWQRVSRTFKGVYDRIKTNKATVSQDPYPVCDIFYTWVRDNAVNETGNEITMGPSGAHYSYIVKPGEKLFPYKRLIISSTRGIIYDGPPLYFNCHVPIVPFKFEHVAGEFLGINIIRDGRRLEESNNNLLRSFEDAVVGKRQPPMGISDKLPKDIRAKLRVNTRLLIGKIFEYSPQYLKEAIIPLLPPEFFNIEAGSIELLRFNQEMSDYLMGTADSSILTKLNQMPAADTQEAFLRSLGTLATDHARGFEQSMIRLAKIWLYFAPQVYTTERVIVKLGADGIIKAMDFDPNSLVPSENDPSYANLSYAQRLQQHIRNFSIYAAPNSLQERMSQTNKLTILQLVKMGIEIPNRKIYDAFMDDGEYQVGRKEWVAEQIEKIKLSAALQKALAEANAAADPQNQMAQGIADLIKGQTRNEGRPPTYNAPPRLEQKMREGIPDSTIASN
jgi:hypothetical protein